MSHQFQHMIDEEELNALVPGAFVEEERLEQAQCHQCGKGVGQIFQTHDPWPTYLDATVAEEDVTMLEEEEVVVEPKERVRRKLRRSYLVRPQDNSRHAAGYNGSSSSDMAETGAGAAEVGFCDEADMLQRRDLPVSPVELNEEDTDGDSDGEHVFYSAKRQVSEKERSRHMRSAEIGARFCCTSAMMGVNPAAIGMARAVFPSSSSVKRADGNTALSFNNNDVTVVRTIAMMLLEEEEKNNNKKRRAVCGVAGQLHA